MLAPTAAALPRNPYDFVPFETPPRRQPWQSLERAPAGTVSGRIHYTLHVHTPLFIHHAPDRPAGTGPDGVPLHDFAHLAGEPRIPATSLKGMLRAVHEIVANGCATISDDFPPPPAGHRPCRQLNQLCPSCRLFGMVSQGKTEGDEPALVGRVLLADIRLDPRELGPLDFPRMRGGPRPGHWAFYRHSPSGPPLGRKLYYHQHDYAQVIAVYQAQMDQPRTLGPYGVRGRGQRQMIRLNAVLPHDAVHPRALAGRLHFVDLTPDELDTLLYTLVLEDHLAHHCGFGKAYGLGTIRITIDQLALEPADVATGIPQRFLCYGVEPAAAVGSVAARRDRAKAAWQGRGNEGAHSYARFADLARWPQEDYFLYPEQEWFQRNAQTRLDVLQRRTPATSAAGPTRSAEAASPAIPEAPEIAHDARPVAVPVEPVAPAPPQRHRGKVVKLRPHLGRIGGGDRDVLRGFRIPEDLLDPAHPLVAGDRVEYEDAADEPRFVDGQVRAARVRKVTGGAP